MKVAELRAEMKERGVTIQRAAHELDMVASTFYRRLANNGEDFSLGEADKLKLLLGMDPDKANHIFFDH